MAFPIVLWASPLRSQTPPARIFPLETGRTWTYAGTVRWTVPGTSEVREEEVEWRMEVLEVVERHPLTAAVLEGHPLDLVWYEAGRTRGRYLLIQVGAGSYYLLNGEEAAKAERRLHDPSDPLIGLVQPHQLFLDAPLWLDKRFCDAESVTREDGSYCWVVESVDTVIIDDVSGILPVPLSTYRIALRTLGEHHFLDIAPGIGLIGFTFGHHGTVSEVDVRLVAVEPTITGGRNGVDGNDLRYGEAFDPYILSWDERCEVARRVLLEGEPVSLRRWAFDDIRSCRDRGAGEALAHVLRENRAVEKRGGELVLLVWISAHHVTDRALFEAALEVAADSEAGERARVEAMRILDGQLHPDCVQSYEDLIDPESISPGVSCIISSHPRPKEGDPLPDDAPEQVRAVLRQVAKDPSAPVSVRTAAGRIR